MQLFLDLGSVKGFRMLLFNMKLDDELDTRGEWLKLIDFGVALYGLVKLIMGWALGFVF